MYTEQDYNDIRRQFKNRCSLLLVPVVLLLAVVIWSFIVRIKYLTMASTIILGFYCLFTYGLLLSPIKAYGKHIYNVLYGRTRTTTGAFKEFEDITVVRDGVEFHPMLISVGDMNKQEDDRLFYYDSHLDKPDWKVGEMLTLTSHDKALGKWERI